MSSVARLAAFAGALLVLFASSYVAGGAINPDAPGRNTPPPTHTHTSAFTQEVQQP